MQSDLFPHIILITSLYGILYVLICLDTVDIETNVFIQSRFVGIGQQCS